MKLIITGGAGFIGSAVIRHLIANTNYSIVNLDILTYAGNLESLESCASNERYSFARVDINDRKEIELIMQREMPDALLHLAAESHVDRSIDGPSEFMSTNIFGTFNLLESARSYLSNRTPAEKAKFRFHHVSTDEVFGDLEIDSPAFNETTPYAPSSPYSASKAASDHLVRAWYRTYGLPTIVSNCSNNYGPFHFPEKLIPLTILNAIDQKSIPVYGDGGQIRDWLYVEDHARALQTILEEGKIGETYNIGGNSEKKNIDVVRQICSILDELLPLKDRSGSYRDLITFVPDRPGHDRRYAVDSSKLENETQWTREETFDSGIRKTVQWFLANRGWCERALAGKYGRERLGVVQ